MGPEATVSHFRDLTHTCSSITRFVNHHISTAFSAGINQPIPLIKPIIFTWSISFNHVHLFTVVVVVVVCVLFFQDAMSMYFWVSGRSVFLMQLIYIPFVVFSVTCLIDYITTWTEDLIKCVKWSSCFIKISLNINLQNIHLYCWDMHFYFTLIIKFPKAIRTLY